MEKTIKLEVTVREMEMLMEATGAMYTRYSRPEYTEHCRKVAAPAYCELNGKLYYELVAYYEKEAEKEAKASTKAKAGRN